MPTSAAIYGCQGTELLDDERAFFKEAAPWGFILFARNCAEPKQISALCQTLRESMRLAAVTNDIFTKEDGEFLIRHQALESECHPYGRAVVVTSAGWKP